MLYCDNDAYVYGLRKTSIRELAMASLQDIVILLIKYDIDLILT